MRVFVAIFALLASAAPAMAEPVVKIVNFTADWCPNCQILNPRIEEAMARFPGEEIERVDLDLTYTRGAGGDKALAEAVARAERHQAGYLWNWYPRGVTGLAAIVSADNGEPISCVNRLLTVDEIEWRLKQAIILARKASPGARMPDGPDCPPPMR